MSAEEDVDLPAVGQGLGVGDLLVVGRGLVLLTELGVGDDEVGTRRTGRLRAFVMAPTTSEEVPKEE